MLAILYQTYGSTKMHGLYYNYSRLGIGGLALSLS